MGKYRFCMEKVECIAAFNEVRKQEREKDRQKIREAITQKKEKSSLGWLKINVRTVCHDYIKLRDKGKPCVSCGQPWSEEHQAGHWKKAELYSTLKYNEFNIHNQCPGCNLYKDGNVQNYSDRIHIRIGHDKKSELEELAAQEKRTYFKWDRIELKEIRDYYKDKIKQLKTER